MGVPLSRPRSRGGTLSHPMGEGLRRANGESPSPAPAVAGHLSHRMGEGWGEGAAAHAKGARGQLMWKTAVRVRAPTRSTFRQLLWSLRVTQRRSSFR